MTDATCTPATPVAPVDALAPRLTALIAIMAGLILGALILAAAEGTTPDTTQPDWHGNVLRSGT